MKCVMIFCCTVFLLASCRKNDDKAENYWKLGTAIYNPVTVFHSGNRFYANDSVGLLTIEFPLLPESTGSYKISGIQARNGKDYAGPAGPVNVIVSAGKITVDLSNVWMIHIPEGKDSLLLSAHLTEQ